MKIKAIKTAEVRGHGYSLFVRIFTDEGIVGTGECIHGGAGAVNLVADMASQLIGENPLDVDRLFEKIRRRHIFDGALAGNLVTAMSGIEIALWDISGKALGVPIYRLLGGKFRDKIRVYADCGSGGEDKNPESYGKKAKEVVTKGFNAIKIDIDDPNDPYKLDQWNWTVSPGELENMVNKVAAVREAVGPYVDLAVDMHGKYDTQSGIRVACALEPYHLMWLEDVVAPENVDAMKRVKDATQTPLCTGESLYLRYGFRELIEKQAVDAIMPDIPKCGGLSECRKIANLAEIYYIPLAPHNVCGPLGTLASCHVCASIPNFLVIEWHWMNRPHWNELVITDEPIIQNGYIKVPEKPGIGVELNDEAARKYMKPNSRFFE